MAATETRQSTPGGGQPILVGSVTLPLVETLAPEPEPLNVGDIEQGDVMVEHDAVQLTVPVSHVEPLGSSPGGGDQASVVILNVPLALRGSEKEPLTVKGGVVSLNA